jgi:hypothetical protein
LWSIISFNPFDDKLFNGENKNMETKQKEKHNFSVTTKLTKTQLEQLDALVSYFESDRSTEIRCALLLYYNDTFDGELELDEELKEL